MKSISCAVCYSDDYIIRFPECIDYKNINFSARHVPSRNHCRIVECKQCGLVYANPILDDEFIVKLCRTSDFINEKQVELMGEDYLEQLRYVDKYIENKDNFLDIGCGNGCFLKKAKEFGYTHVYGVEPSKHAVNQADPIIKDFIINDVFKKGLFKEGFFDLVCAIQVFDHLVEPNDVLINIEKVLKKRGFILTINHNIRFLLTKILGEKSPMYDIEHIYLFDKVTMARLLEKHGFKCLYLKDMWSRYTIGHILKMFPFPNLIKNLLQRAISQLGVKDKKIKLMGGNIVAFAQKVD